MDIWQIPFPESPESKFDMGKTSGAWWLFGVFINNTLSKFQKVILCETNEQL